MLDVGPNSTNFTLAMRKIFYPFFKIKSWMCIT